MELFNEETLRRIHDNDPALKILRISDIATPNPNLGDVGTYVPADDGAGFARLGDAIGGNAHLETLCIDGDQQGLDDKATRSLFDGIQSNSSIRRLSLCRCDLSQEEGAVREILRAFREYGNDGNGTCHYLVGISLQRCILGNNGAIHALASTLSRCANIECIRIRESRGNLRQHDGLPFFLLNHAIDESLPQLVAAITKGCRKLKELDLGQNDVIGSDSCRALAEGLLKDSTCNLVTLNMENNLLDGKCATVLADAMTRNKTLKNLYLHGNPIFSCAEILDDSFSSVLCDTSSISDTYFSNHTLTSFVPWSWSVPPYLGLNRRSSDTKQIAMQKILLHHPLIDMEPLFTWKLKVLPVAVKWFESARKCAAEDVIAIIDKKKLTAVYQFVNAMPTMFVPVLLGPSTLRKWKKVEQ